MSARGFSAGIIYCGRQKKNRSFPSCVGPCSSKTLAARGSNDNRVCVIAALSRIYHTPVPDQSTSRPLQLIKPACIRDVGLSYLLILITSDTILLRSDHGTYFIYNILVSTSALAVKYSYECVHYILISFLFCIRCMWTMSFFISSSLQQLVCYVCSFVSLTLL